MPAVRLHRLSRVLIPVIFLLSFAILLTGCGSSNKPSSGTTGNGNGGSGSTGSSGTQPSSASVHEVVYVADSADDNVWAWMINSNASVSAVAGSPFAVGGQSLAAIPSPQFLFSLGGTTPGSTAVNTDTIGSSESLSITSSLKDPTLTSGMSINPSGTALYVDSISAAQQNPGWKIYSVQPDGTLSFVSGIIDFSATRLVFTSDGTTAYEPYCFHLAANIVAYAVSSNGALTAITSQVPQVDSMTECPNAVAIMPTGNTLAATWSDADNVGPVDNRIVLYSINPSTHSLTQSLGPFNASGAGVDATFDPSGKFLVTAQDNGIGVYQITANAVTEVPGSPFASGVNFNRVMFSPSGSSVSAISRTSGQLYVFSFNSGTGALTTGAGSPVSVKTPNDLTVVKH